jgi:hypothetical protein
MFVCVYSVFVLSCVGSGLARGRSLVQGVLPIVYKYKIPEPHKEEAKARNGLERHIRRRRRGPVIFLWTSSQKFVVVLIWCVRSSERSLSWFESKSSLTFFFNEHPTLVLNEFREMLEAN